ncbi:hypothetical protein EUAN_12420 [Andreesenia angusta]|uniref:Phage head-tail joining protein n=1 Tax=Andreesenia angusta TaxID=39480 RepID=A0A1S1V6B3_9FIRM|nr:hypothetical protein [Andreesenia angusta]OHW62173.1 hypothetical protein EUAN_12420 [Andreesenia angusta]
MTEAEVLATLYTDICTISRSLSGADSDGFDSFSEAVVYDSIQCGVDFTRGSTEGIKDLTQPIAYLAELYVKPDISIKAGDKVVATVQDRTYKFIAGEGIYFASHGQIPLIREGNA